MQLNWFAAEDHGHAYSDHTLNVTQHFLQEFSDIYQQELQRKPTLGELELVLKVVLQSSADADVLSHFDEQVVTDVKIKTAKRKKKQPFAIGDLFAIPLLCGGYAFGRIISHNPSGWIACQIYSFYSKNKQYTPAIETSPDLCHPLTLTPHAITDWDYTIIKHDPTYHYLGLDTLKFLMGGPGNYSIEEVKTGAYYKAPDMTEAEASGMERLSFPCGTEEHQKKIEAALREKGLIS